MLGDLRITFIAAVTIPFAVLFAFGMMVLTGRSANLISIGAIDFGILVDSSIIVLESIYRKLSRRIQGEETGDLIVEGVTDAARPVLFSTAIILVAFIPLFTMQGVAGQIFSPMSVTYGFALLGALIFALIFAPVLGYITAPDRAERRRRLHLAQPLPPQALRHSPPPRSLRHTCHRLDRRRLHARRRRRLCFILVGGEFMPPLEEGNLWIRATLPQDISFDTAANIADQLRAVIANRPRSPRPSPRWAAPTTAPTSAPSTTSKSPSPSSPPDEWRPGLTKPQLIEEMNHRLSRYPRHGPQLLPEHPGQRRRGHVRRQGRELPQALRRRLRHPHQPRRQDSSRS